MARAKKKPERNKCECAFCKNDRAFAIPDHLVQQIKDQAFVLFAGAGISTENRAFHPDTFYEEIAHELEIGEELSFPDLMQKYCDLPDGRIKFYTKLKHRLDYIKSFKDLYEPMTRFHRAISPLFFIKNIITTNWDDFFERECEMDTFIEDTDIPLMGGATRRLLKIHGSIRNPGSIVATRTDYRKSLRRLTKGPMGSEIKTLMAHKTIIYTGYSLSDDNYISLARTIRNMCRPHIRHSYFISPHIDHAKLERFPIPLIPIETDGAFFFEELRKHLETELHIIREEAFELCEDFLERVLAAHEKLAHEYTKKYRPLLPFALSYQDGMIHALDRIRTRRKSGEYHDAEHVHALVHGYVDREKKYLSKKDYWNSSYARGYQNIMLYLAALNEHRNAPTPPLYGEFRDISFETLNSLLRYPLKYLNNSIKRQARKMWDHVQTDKEIMIPDHTPFV